jgi:hypothetical protein
MLHSLDRERLLKELKVRRIHITPRLLTLLTPETAARFANPWEPVERLAAMMGRLPLGALRFLLVSPSGALVLTHADSGYVRGPYPLHRKQLENAALIPAAALLEDDVAPLRLTACLYDHLLGSGGAAGGPNLSDGIGITPRWTEVAAQIPRLFALGHNPDPTCRRSPADYFAQSVALYATRPKGLNVADPAMYKLLTRSFFSENFWRQKHADN